MKLNYEIYKIHYYVCKKCKKIKNLSLRYILKDKFSINNLPIKNAVVKTYKEIYKK